MSKLLYLITEDWFFCSHFLDRAVASREAGYEVIVVTRVRHHGQVIENAGLRLLNLEIDRGGLNPFADLKVLLQLVSLYRAERPDLVHHIALKPILLGVLAARLTGVGGVINALVGMGFVFASQSLLARALRPLVSTLLRLTLTPAGGRVIFENPDDLREFVAKGLVDPNAVLLIPGAGVDTNLFVPKPRANRVPVVMLVARMLWDKGVGEFVAAARILRERGVSARFVLVGAPDIENREHIPEAILSHWQQQGFVEWWGQRERMHDVLQEADVACLPSYREGLPKALLEAMSTGLACVTTDVTGCRSVVTQDINGLLVPPRNAQLLADALNELIADSDLRQRMGRNGRERAKNEFSNERIVAATLDAYKSIQAR